MLLFLVLEGNSDRFRMLHTLSPAAHSCTLLPVVITWLCSAIIPTPNPYSQDTHPPTIAELIQVLKAVRGKGNET